jgi:hypothetical protein
MAESKSGFEPLAIWGIKDFFGGSDLTTKVSPDILLVVVVDEEAEGGAGGGGGGGLGSGGEILESGGLFIGLSI